jgi:hypothetical protein
MEFLSALASPELLRTLSMESPDNSLLSILLEKKIDFGACSTNDGIGTGPG